MSFTERFEPITITGLAPGKNVLIIACVHGDEPCGARAFERILPKLTLVRGSATFIIGNPRALEQKVRFTEANLNRMFREDQDLSQEKRRSYEYARSRELIPFLECADALLDIHSSESPIADPFIVCGERSRAIAELMPFPIISWGWDAVEPGGTDDYMERAGKIGICVECGYDLAPATFDKAEEAINQFLALMGLTDMPPAPSWPQKRLKATYAHIADTNFMPVAMVPDFTAVKEGELIGVDGTRPMHAPKDGYLIFVRTRNGPGQEAYVFAEEIC